MRTRALHFGKAPLAAIVILAVISPLVCSGASFRHINDGELWRESDTIVLGTVTSITSEGGGYYYVEVEVERYLKNPSEASTIVIHYYLRTYSEMFTSEEGTVVVPSDSSEPEWGFGDGERVYVFLRRVTPDLYEVVGGFQGKYSFVNGVGVSSIGRVIRIPTPSSQTDMLGVAFGATFGVVVLITIWIKREWLSERIVGVIR